MMDIQNSIPMVSLLQPRRVSKGFAVNGYDNWSFFSAGLCDHADRDRTSLRLSRIAETSRMAAGRAAAASDNIAGGWNHRVGRRAAHRDRLSHRMGCVHRFR